MGVDFITCSYCSDNFPDCGSYGWCVCEDVLCDRCVRKFKKEFGTIETEDYGECCNGCNTCKLIEPSEKMLLNFAIFMLKTCREDLEDTLRVWVETGDYKI